jgi:hypothetical protein
MPAIDWFSIIIDDWNTTIYYRLKTSRLSFNTCIFVWLSAFTCKADMKFWSLNKGNEILRMIRVLITDTLLVPEGERTAISNIESSHSRKKAVIRIQTKENCNPKSKFLIQHVSTNQYHCSQKLKYLFEVQSLSLKYLWSGNELFV